MKRKRKDLTVSLFPFLSILACVIGSITLMIASAVLSQIDPGAVSEAEQRVEKEMALRREYAKLQKQVSAAEVVLTEFNKLDASLNETNNDLAAKEASYAEIQAKLNALIGNHPMRAKLLAQTTSFEQRINELQPLLKEKLEKIASLQKLMKEQEVKKPRLGKVVVRPTGSGEKGKIKPLFVDCRDTGLVVHDGGLDPWEVPRSEIGKNSKWISLLKAEAARNQRTIVFLVRLNAIPVFAAAEGVCNTHGVRNGRIPVQALGDLDLSHFN
jgi:hypothetical protein